MEGIEWAGSFVGVMQTGQNEIEVGPNGIVFGVLGQFDGLGFGLEDWAEEGHRILIDRMTNGVDRMDVGVRQ